MNIKSIVNINNVSGIKPTQGLRPRLNLGLQKDTFERTSFKGNFNADDAIMELKEIKNFKGTPKFNDEKLEIIKKELIKAPDKWEPFKTLVQNPKIFSALACEILEKDVNIVQNLADLSAMKKEDNSPRFSPFDIKAFSQKVENNEDYEKAKVLAQCNLETEDIIALSKNNLLKTPNKVVEYYNKMEKDCGENALSIKFQTDYYDPNAFALIADLKDTSKKIELFDKDLNIISTEEVKARTFPNGKQYQIKKTIDNRTNTISKVKLEVNKKLPQPVLINEIRVVRDKNGKTLRKEYTDQSEIPGVLNIKHVFPDGSEKILSQGSVDKKTGITTVKKDMTSLDGTRTQYLYENDPQGNRISDYIITDKNGNVLLKNSQSFEVISDNKFISAKNDQKYEITVNEKEINIKNLKDNKDSKLTFENYIDGNKEKILDVLKKMPGEELIALSKTVKHLNGIDDINYSTYGVVNKRIKTGDNLFVMLHELGHAKDYNEVDVKQEETLKKSIFSNKKINEVFEKEKALFNEAFPAAQREHINYFIKTSEEKDGLQETIAETNALLNTYNNEDLFSIRSQYLQQYFPRTVAELSKILSK
ncbi:hypothetical protein IJ818_06140 [bacterium]|nr:hypothetical protein [bacterium]